MSRPPLVYASPAAIRVAHRLLPGRVLENEVERAIVEGRVALSGRRANERGRAWGPGWGAVIVRTPGKYRKSPRAWTVVGLEASGRSERTAPSPSSSIGGKR